MKYEVEIKSLLGSKDAVDNLKRQLGQLSGFKRIGGSNQLNHYFIYTSDDGPRLLESAKNFLSPEAHENLQKIMNANEVSVRTRDADGKIYFVAKLSIGDDSSANGVKRIEIQEQIDLTLDELDQKLLDAGLEYQAKWSRERENFQIDDMQVTIDKNAGYGYVSEFELEVNDEAQIDAAYRRIKDLMQYLSIEELAQDRLERMFEHYNKNWEHYYGTDKILVIE